MILCPKCDGESSVLDSRRERRTIVRRRRCDKCGHAWRTIETKARTWRPLGKKKPEHIAAISAARIAKADATLARKERIPVECVATFRHFRTKLSGSRRDYAEARAMAREIALFEHSVQQKTGRSDRGDKA